MATAIVLTAEQADEVRGVSSASELTALEPQPLTDGRFYLGAAVLDDPSHAEHRDLLASCPLVDFEDLRALLPAVEDDDG